jgi:hypothetical protein
MKDMKDMKACKAKLEQERLALDVAQQRLWLKRDRERFEAESNPRATGPTYGKVAGEKEIPMAGFGLVGE